MANIFGSKWTFTSFGESHGAAIGGVLDGVPAGLHIDFDLIRNELNRRAARSKHLGDTATTRQKDGNDTATTYDIITTPNQWKYKNSRKKWHKQN